MSWARLDDRANEHRKQLLAGSEACWLWACGLMYANRQDARDGFIPEPMLAMLYPFRAPKKLASKLVKVGLWEAVPGGYRIHGYHDWNPTKEQVEAERAKGRERAAASYQKRKPKTPASSPEDSECSSPEDETKKSVSSGVEWSGEGSSSGSGSLPEGDTGEPEAPEAPDPKKIPHPLPVDWKPWPTTAGTLEISNAIPAWAVAEIARRFVAHYAVDTSSRSTAVGWQQRFTRWAAKDWSDPSKRPAKPEPTAADRAARNAAADAAWDALVARERAERLPATPPPLEESKAAVRAVLAAARAQSARGST